MVTGAHMVTGAQHMSLTKRTQDASAVQSTDQLVQQKHLVARDCHLTRT